MTYPVFATGDVLNASDMNAVSGWLVASGTVSGGTVLNADSVFTSNYENYCLIISQMQVNTAGRAFRINFRASGSTNTAANYDYGYNGYKANGTANNASNAGGTFAEIGVYIDTFANSRLGSCTIDIYAPQISTQTIGTSQAQGYEGAIFYRSGGFCQTQVTVFDGFQISLSGSGTMSFNWKLYGYR